MTLRLDDPLHEALRQQAERDGMSMQDAARIALTSYLEARNHQARVHRALEKVLVVHADALERLGQ